MPELGFARGMITLLTLFTFLGICWWAYRPGNKARFEQDGWMAFDEQERKELDESGTNAVGEQRR